MTEIVHHGHKDAKGTDICGMKRYQYIIRPDLGYYMRANHLHGEERQVVYPLHPSCSKGDHYLATMEGYVYIINGSKCRVVKGGETALRDDNDPEVFQLDPRCQGGDFYLAKTRENFFVIFADRGEYLQVNNLRPDPALQKLSIAAPILAGATAGGVLAGPLAPVGFMAGASVGGVLALARWLDLKDRGETLANPASKVEYKPLHDACKGGLYYFATEGWFYVLKQVDPIWGLQYLRTRNLSTNSESSIFSIHQNVAKFLPGGLALTKGRAFACWEKLGSTSNSLDKPIPFTDEYVYKVGYKKEEHTEIEHSWKVETSASDTAGKLTESLFQAQFSLTVGYGGHHLNTKTEDWTEESKITKKFDLEVAPGKSIYAWQLKMGLGGQEVLRFKDIIYTDTPDQPELPAGTN